MKPSSVSQIEKYQELHIFTIYCSLYLDNMALDNILTRRGKKALYLIFNAFRVKITNPIYGLWQLERAVSMYTHFIPLKWLIQTSNAARMI